MLRGQLLRGQPRRRLLVRGQLWGLTQGWLLERLERLLVLLLLGLLLMELMELLLLLLLLLRQVLHLQNSRRCLVPSRLRSRRLLLCI